MINHLFSKPFSCIVLSLIFLLISIQADAQITGTVTDDENNETLIGASIFISGTDIGTFTDITGKFSIDAKPGDVITFSYVGYEDQIVTLGEEKELTIKLIQGVVLAEIVVTGYSVDTRRKTAGSVSTVNARDLQIAPSGNVEQQLQGRVPGVTVITNGQPGTTSQVRVRGYGALGGNAPLFVVDGVPVSSIDFLSPGDIESITVLKDATAASIYGARAAGGVIVYTTKKGKKGKEKINISYNGMFGVTSPETGYQVMSPQDQADWTWTAIRNAATLAGLTPEFSHPQYGTGDQPVLPDYLLVGPDAGVIGTVDLNAQSDLYNIDHDSGPIYQVVKANKEGTDWYDAMTRNALIHRHHLGFSGGGEANRFFVGFGIQDQEGILLNQNFSRYTFRVNTEFDILPGLRIGENFQGTYRSTRFLAGEEGGIGAADNQTFIFNSSVVAPIIPIYDEFGGYGGNAAPGVGQAFGNPVSALERGRDNRDFTTQTFGNVYVELEPREGLVIRSSFGGRFVSVNKRQYFKKSYENLGSRNRSGFSQFSSYAAQWTLTNTLNYKRTIGLHSLDILLGQEALDEGTGFNISAFGSDPFSDNIDFIGLSTLDSRTVEGSPFNGVRFSSFFTRLNYDYSNKYLLSIVVRRDGSSRFGEENRFGVFPAISGAWRISSESFMSGINIIEDLKIRGGFGIMGNSNNVDPNNQFSLFGTSLAASSYDITGTNSSATGGFYRTRIGNIAAKWEQAITANVGVDALFFNGKLDVGVEFWRKETEDLLFQVPVTVQTGFFADAPFVNVGKMLNKGIDFTIINKGRAGHFTYQFTLNGGFLQNEIVELSPGIEDLPNRSITYNGITPVLNQVGQPLSAFYGFDVQGIFRDQAEVDGAAIQEGAAPGRFRFRDVTGDGIIDQQDRINLGNPIADFTGGLAVKVGYKSFELEVYTYTSLGNEIYNLSKSQSDFFPSIVGGAISTRVFDSWTFENPTGEIPIFENTSNFSTNTQSSSYYVEDGSYFRMQNITFSYLLPQTLLRKWDFKNVRIYASVNNAFTITSYSGLDPGVGGISDTNFGVDRGNIPLTRNYVFGVNVDF